MQNDLKLHDDSSKRATHAPSTATDTSDDLAKNAGAANRKAQNQNIESQAETTARPDPTRYGDWEINGRCIDF
jgi:hypothetical protein